MASLKEVYHLLDCAFLYCYSVLQDEMTINALKVELIHYLSMKDLQVILGNDLKIEITFLNAAYQNIVQLIDGTVISLSLTCTLKKITLPVKKIFYWGKKVDDVFLAHYNLVKTDLNHFKNQLSRDFTEVAFLARDMQHSTVEINSFCYNNQGNLQITPLDIPLGLKEKTLFLPFHAYQINFISHYLANIVLSSIFVCQQNKVEYLENGTFNLLVFY